MNERHRLLIAAASIVGAAGVSAWLILLPDDPVVSLSNGATAATLASIVLLGKLRRDREPK